MAAAGSPQIKQQLTDITKMVVEKRGAFGNPWFWVTNSAGKSEPFFGSDRYVLWLLSKGRGDFHRLFRFHFMWEFLGLPWQDVKLLPKEEAVKAHL
jgi:hypothetical protein